MGLISSIFFWLFIFIVGSLIVSWILDPTQFDKLKTKVSDFMQENIRENIDNNNLTKNVSSSSQVSLNQVDAKVFCSMLETSNLRELMCDFVCDRESQTYVKHGCVDRKLVCHCK